MAASPGGLQISQDMEFQRREWKLEHAGRIAIFLIALAGLAGLLGPGPLSHTTAGAEGSTLWAIYNRFERYQSPMTVQVFVRAEADTTAVALTHGYLRHFQLEGIEPSPIRVIAGPEAVTFLFATEPALRILHVTYRLKAEEACVAAGEVQMPGGPGVSIAQLIYP